MTEVGNTASWQPVGDDQRSRSLAEGYIRISSRVHHLKFLVVLTAVKVRDLRFGFDDLHGVSGLPLSSVKHRGATMPNKCADPACCYSHLGAIV